MSLSFPARTAHLDGGGAALAPSEVDPQLGGRNPLPYLVTQRTFG